MENYLNSFIELDVIITNSKTNQEEYLPYVRKQSSNYMEGLIQENKCKTEEEKEEFFSRFWNVK